jgi:hypothetical protein
MFEKCGGALARRRLAIGSDRVFEIDDDRIAAAGERLIELAIAVGRSKQKRAH